MIAVGQKVLLFGWGTEKECAVARVGRDYFYLDEPGRIAKYRFPILPNAKINGQAAHRCKDGDYTVYADIEAYHAYKKLQALRSDAQCLFLAKVNALTLEQLDKIMEVLNG